MCGILAYVRVASTRAFTAQVTVLSLIALAHKKDTIRDSLYRELTFGLDITLAKVEKILKNVKKIKEVTHLFAFYSTFLFSRQGLNFLVALEDALKLKEISYIHAEAYPAAEIKHGLIALIDEDMPVVFIATKDSSHEKIISNIQEVKA